MTNPENSKPRNKNLKNIEQSHGEAVKNGKKGGIKSGEIRRAKKTMREMLDYLLDKEITNGKGEKVTTKEATAVALIKKAIQGDVKAFEVIRDTIGEKPVEQHDVRQIEPPVIKDDI